MQPQLRETALDKGIEAAIAGFNGFNRATERSEQDGIPYFVNEFWTASQRQSHSINEISYRACFKAELPQFFIDSLTHEGDVVYDPFMGRGTTLVQAALQNRNVCGNDVNPLSKLLARPRLLPVDYAGIVQRLQDLDLSKGRITREDLLVFYHRRTLQELEALKSFILAACPLDEERPDRVIDWIRMVAINRLTGHSNGFFSVRTMPPNQAVSVAVQHKLNEKHGNRPEPRDIPLTILRKTRSLLRDGYNTNDVSHKLLAKQAWDTPEIATASIDLVVTSPPFLDIVQYAADNWLRCWFAGIDPESIQIAEFKSPEAWAAMVHDVLAELARVVKPGGHVAFEVGEVRNGKVLLEKLVWEAARGLPFNRIGVMVNDQNFTKTANCWGVTNSKKGTNTNRIVIMERQ